MRSRRVSDERVAVMRREFDASFERAIEPAAPHEDLLILSVGRAHFAAPLAMAARVTRARDLAPARARARALLGVLAVEASIVPAYDLGVLLDLASNAAPRAWALLTRSPAVALLFDQVVGHHRRTRDDAKVIVIGGEPVRIVDLERLVAAIASECRAKVLERSSGGEP